MKAFTAVAVALATLALIGCGVHQTEVPPLTGPSDLALSISVLAVPDSINQDGGSQSSIKVTVFGPNGKGQANVAIRLDMRVNGVAQDYGTLSARNLVTKADGSTDPVTYTAPPSPAGGAFGTCGSLPGNCVEIVATTSSGSAFQTAVSQSVQIRLIPPGVILPPAGTPTAAFTFTPTPVSVNLPISFDASTSVPGTNATSITSYSWSWGDGTSNSTDRTVTHTFLSGGSFNVTLTVTNDRGLQASASQAVSVSAADPFTGDWISSPPLSAGAVVGQHVIFNADQVQTSVGHQVTVFNWNFGDGDTAQPTTGFLVTHTFARAGTYSVVLSVSDDLGRKKVFTAKTIQIGSGNPIPSFTLSPGAPTGGVDVLFDASGTQVFGDATIQSYQWTFPSGNPSSSSNGPQATTRFAVSVNPYTVSVTLTVVDSLGRRGTTSVSVTVSP